MTETSLHGSRARRVWFRRRPVNEIFQSEQSAGADLGDLDDFAVAIGSSNPNLDAMIGKDYSRKIAHPDEGGQALVQSIKVLRAQIKRDLTA